MVGDAEKLPKRAGFMTTVSESRVGVYVETLLDDLRRPYPISWYLLEGPSESSGQITLFEDMSVELEITFSNILVRDQDEESFPEIVDTYRIETDDLEDLLVRRGETWKRQEGLFLFCWVHEDKRNSWPELLRWLKDQQIPMWKRTNRLQVRG